MLDEQERYSATTAHFLNAGDAPANIARVPGRSNEAMTTKPTTTTSATKAPTTAAPGLAKPAAVAPSAAPASAVDDLERYGWNMSTFRSRKGAIVVIHTIDNRGKLGQGIAKTIPEAYQIARTEALKGNVVPSKGKAVEKSVETF
jgi:hypothetical protein